MSDEASEWTDQDQDVADAIQGEPVGALRFPDELDEERLPS